MSDPANPNPPQEPPVASSPPAPSPQYGQPVPQYGQPVPQYGQPAPQYGEYAPTPPNLPQYAMQTPPPLPDQAAGVPGGKKPLIVWDMVLTIILLVIGAIVMFIGITTIYSLGNVAIMDELYRDMGYLGRFNGEIGAGPAVVTISHILLYLAGAGLSIFMLMKRKISFYIPLIAGVIAAIIFWTVLIGFFLSDPNFVDMASRI